jgi:hypothetical protein
MGRDDEYNAAIAHQARVTYATQQLHTCQAALGRWQEQATQSTTESERKRAQFEVAYHSREVERWQGYLTQLGPIQPVFVVLE